MNDDVIILSEIETFAKRYSVSMKERYESAQLNLEPDLRFDVRTCDYNGENELLYNGVKYSIYRTYEKGDFVELYVEKKLGRK